MGSSNTTIIDEAFKIFNQAKSANCRFWIGWNLGVATYDPKFVEFLLTNEHCLNKPFIYKYLHVDTSILVVDKESWKSKRRALNTAFTATALQSYVPLLNQKTRIISDRIGRYVSKRCDVYRIVFIGMVDTVTRTLMGVDMHLQSKRGEMIYSMLKQIANSVMYRTVRFWLQNDFMYNCTKVGRAEGHTVQKANDFINEIYDKRINDPNMQHSQLNAEIDANGVNNILDKCLQLERTGTFNHENVLDHMRVNVLDHIRC